jgi:hypothetical protein
MFLTCLWDLKWSGANEKMRENFMVGMQITAVWVTCLCFQLVSGLKWSGANEKMRENFMVGMQITAVWVTCLRFNLSLVGYGLERTRRSFGG